MRTIENKPYDNTQSRYTRPYDNTQSKYTRPYEHKPYEHKPYEHKPYEHKPYENKPYENKPYENKSYENKPDYYRQKQNPDATEVPVFAEQKIYQSAFSTAPVKHTDHTHPRYTNPAFLSVENNTMYPPSFVAGSSDYFPYMKPLQNINEIPLQNVYNINLGNPSVHSNNLSRIYEDALPGEPYNFTMKSIFERIHLINFMRNSMVKLHDGEEMTMQVGPDSFLEYIRLLEFNPFTLGVNPYNTIPSNFLLYGGAYPIRYNMNTRQIDIAKHGMGVCIRMYMMSIGAIYHERLGANITSNNFDVWREIKYYQYVREQFFNKKICSNFISMILYKFDSKSKINYENIYNITGQHGGSTQIRSKQISADINNQVNNNIIALRAVGLPGPPSGYPQIRFNDLVGKDLRQDSNRSMIVLTESPTCNLIEWASPIYKPNGVINTMISTGYHSPEIWKSILFQLSYAMAVLQKHQIYFRGFTIERNVFIKDLFVNTYIGYWIYNIDGIEYYVPNYGYIVVIDSSYEDVNQAIPIIVGLHAGNLATQRITGAPNPPVGLIDVPTPILPGNTTTAPAYLYKILSPILYTTTNGTDDPTAALTTGKTAHDDACRGILIPLNEYIYHIGLQFQTIMNVTKFTNEYHTQYAMEPPDQEILDVITKLSRINPIQTTIADHLRSCFPEYLHNKIGTSLTKPDIDTLNPAIQQNFTKGKLIVYKERYNEYKWAIYIGDGATPGKKKIYTKIGPNYQESDVFIGSLVHFPDGENITQIGDRPYKLTKDALIETYIFQ